MTILPDVPLEDIHDIAFLPIDFLDPQLVVIPHTTTILVTSLCLTNLYMTNLPDVPLEDVVAFGNILPAPKAFSGSATDYYH